MDCLSGLTGTAASFQLLTGCGNGVEINEEWTGYTDSSFQAFRFQIVDLATNASASITYSVSGPIGTFPGGQVSATNGGWTVHRVPEPSTISLIVTGLLVLLALRYLPKNDGTVSLKVARSTLASTEFDTYRIWPAG